jgi:hypothetical protein
VIAGSVVATAYRIGYEGYTKFLLGWQEELHTSLQSYKGIISNEANESHRHLLPLELQDLIYPFDWFKWDFPTVAAIAGAYLFVATTMIQGFRSRTLVRADLLRCSLRMVIAVPLGMSIAGIAAEKASPAWGVVAAFVLLTLSTKKIARILSGGLAIAVRWGLGDKDPADRLLVLQGVSPEVAAILVDEGITSVAQLACYDPVTLAIRSGLSFDFILNLEAQSQVWVFLGQRAHSLTRLGLGDARAIRRLINEVDNGVDAAKTMLKRAANLIDPTMLTLRPANLYRSVTMQL